MFDFLRRKPPAEARESYTDLLTAGLATRLGGSSADVLVTGAAEIAAGFWGRVLAAADVRGTAALTKRVRHRIGREIVRQGECVFLLDLQDGSPILRPVADWDVLEGYSYSLTWYRPPGGALRQKAPRDAVAHFMWAEHPREPWRGLGPLVSASKLAEVAASAESKLAEDLRTPTAHILPIPADGGQDTLASLRTDIGTAKGEAILAETTIRGWGEGEQGGTRHDWRSERLGPDVPADLRGAWRESVEATLAACGIPASLAGFSDADGTQLREDYRRAIMTSVEPVASMVAEEASRVLETEVSFSFRNLWAHDIAGRAQAFSALTGQEENLPVDRAVTLLGLDR